MYKHIGLSWTYILMHSFCCSNMELDNEIAEFALFRIQ